MKETSATTLIINKELISQNAIDLERGISHPLCFIFCREATAKRDTSHATYLLA